MHPLLRKAGSCAAVLIAGTGFLLGTASPAAADSTSQVSISIQGPATLIAHGAAISVPVVTSCSTAYTVGTVILTVTQTVGRRVASDSLFVGVDCTGLPETTVITLYSDQVPFSKGGTAFAQGEIISCNGSMECVEATDSTTIKIQ